MDKNEKALQELMQGIAYYIKQTIEHSNITAIETGLIVSTGTDEGYKVKLNNLTYDNIKALNGAIFGVNDTIKVVIPNGNYNDMFILGKI
jgi:hypothetical protein